jgi:hypothetical protein
MGRVVYFALHAVERISAPTSAGLMAIGGVWIYGLDQLQLAIPAVGAYLESGLSFTDRWRDAICLFIGTEEFEKFCLARQSCLG